ncbi:MULTISPECIES: thiamine pyrophosphate-binding protein [unclassified Pseudomonas]|uniref:thiamine pyrophosphate-binding protein n=1 Tax=unclassified Pseudomonas TaxID=196821 RepID=UPI0008775403|nr:MULTISPECIES: thiamine pyrophosphate-binding protein [unclassified Pseudomonas]SCZ20315.1 benzoylformate decarboxylase [Pseudomonas sp. NFACC44-2]SDA44612.1 benzoylformate decarboxylase [Pseudomonas sp. NFACC51]SFH07934.1 benzoylformate decarboxylase [Pseudomonas sp. NFACC54]SFS42186.1 benzoylformate decarboxylase [Pseudomonas sp. NFACC48-1]
MPSTPGVPSSIRGQRGADLLVEVLHSESVRHVFGNPGTTELPLLDALSGVSDIHYVLGLQEASVVAMADGYAQASGRPGFVNLHTAGGLGNAMGTILNAKMANTPLVITAGQQDTRHGVTDPLLHGDLVSLARPSVKWAEEIQHPQHIPMLLRRALQDCRTGPTGPVFLSLPINVMEQHTDADAGQPSRIERGAVTAAIDPLADALSTVTPGRLAIIVGEEVFQSNAQVEAVSLAEALGAPVFGPSWPGHIPFPTAHPQWRGALPPKAADIRETFADFDAVLLLGGHSLISYQYSQGPAIPSHCRLIQLTGDGHQLGRVHGTALGLIGDIKLSLQLLLPLLDQALAPHSQAIATLRNVAAHERSTRRIEVAERAKREFHTPVTTPFVAAHEAVRAIGPDVWIVDEAPVTIAHVRACLDSHSARQYLFTRSAILGWGMPAAVGTSLGLDRTPVVCLVGDGSAMYSPQALWTAAHERLPVTFVVMNNGEYNILKNYARNQAHYRSAGTNQFIGMDIRDPAIDFQALASSLGVASRRVERARDIAEAVEDGIRSGRPNLIELPIMA